LNDVRRVNLNFWVETHSGIICDDDVASISAPSLGAWIGMQGQLYGGDFS